MEKIEKYFFGLVGILVLKSLILAWVIFSGEIGLAPDEAQYWTWSQELDWGYYSKPPGIAWQIFLGSSLFGNSEFGVRSTAIAVGFLISLAIFFLARGCGLKPATCFLAGLIFALSPLGVMLSFFSITDGGMIFFWTCVCVCLVYSFEKPWFVGLLIMVGALFKWPIYILWIFIVGFYPRMIAGFFISLMGLLPSVVWNFSHNWVTFRHVLGTNILGRSSHEVGTTPLSQGNFWDFLGAQVILLSPIFFIFFVGALFYLLRKVRRPQLMFCGCVSGSIVVIYCCMALFKKMQGNWCMFAYPTGIVLLAWYACECISWGKKGLVVGVVVSLALIIGTFSVPYIQSHNLFSSYQIPYRINPFRHNLGWGQLKKELSALGYNPKEHFLFSDKYQMSSILSFYSERQKRAYFLNLNAIRKNQFSFWPSMAEEQKNKDGFFVLAENVPHLEKTEGLVKRYENLLKNYFDEVVYLGAFPLFHSYQQMVKGALFFKCINYHGNLPTDPDLY